MVELEPVGGTNPQDAGIDTEISAQADLRRPQVLFTRRRVLELGAAGGAIFVASVACGGKDSPPSTPTSTPIAPEPTFEIATITPQDRQNQRRRELHYPFVEGVKLKAEPYLTLPFREEDIRTPEGLLNYRVSEGWLYSEEELKITKLNPEDHWGVDIALPYGTPLLAPADGRAMSSYWHYILKGSDDKPVIHEEKEVGFGFGYFVQMYIPSADRYITLAHLSEINTDLIPFNLPVPLDEDGEWYPSNHDLTKYEIPSANYAYSDVKKGDIVGLVGFSGLTWGYEDYDSKKSNPVVIDPTVSKSWDEAHVHWEEHGRESQGQSKGTKIAQRDVFGVYDTAEHYPSPSNPDVLLQKPLILLDSSGIPKFA